MEQDEYKVKFLDYVDGIFKSMFEVMRYEPIDTKSMYKIKELLSMGFDSMNMSGDWGNTDYAISYEIDDGIIYNMFVRLVNKRIGKWETGFVISFSHNVCDIKRVR